MVLSSAQPIGRLPLELLHEICSRLDNKSLKSFRLACADPTVSAATASSLFRTVSIGLGTLDWSMARRKAQPLDIPDLKHTSCVKELVVDTRYPFYVSEELCLKRYQEFNDRTNQSTFLSEKYTELIPEWEQNCFLELLQGLFETLGAVCRVHWRTSDRSQVAFQKGLFMILSQYCHDRNCDLDVSLTLEPTAHHSRAFLYDLSNVRNLEIRSECVSQCLQSSGLSFEDMTGIANIIEQSKDLRSFTLSTIMHAFFHVQPATIDPISVILSKGCGPEKIRGNLNWEVYDKLGSIRLKNLKHLKFNAPRGWNTWWGAHKVHVVLNQLASSHAPTRLENFATNMLDSTIQNFLQSPQLSLTDLRLNLDYCDTPEAGEIFWKKVLPICAKTLRRLKVKKTGDHDFAWTWLHEPNNNAKLALRQCHKLEVLSIAFCKPTVSYIMNMISDLVCHCPSLRLIRMNFEQRTMIANMDQTMTKLTLWNTFAEEFKGRNLTVRYKRSQMPKRWHKKRYQFREHVEEGFEPPMWFDFVIQSWKLSQIYPGIFGFKRQHDQYITDRDRFVEY
ncbi:hypothetical protein TWF694_003037 [Orbilia ellipsospora]|uniref:F-box domain-containing protein n=1 Tax=Orbilia ellipsospora TaxID=2528407 RepID=A0AAV9X1L7_9PEZI